jgi:LCP family protein required for cell wall assembly
VVGARLSDIRGNRGTSSVGSRAAPHRPGVPPDHVYGDPGPGPGPDEPPKLKSPLWTRILIIAGCVLVVVSGGALALVYGLSARYENQVGRQDILDGVPQALDGEHGTNFLVLGSDSREQQNTQSLDETGSRSDTILIVHVKHDLSGAFIVSIPRDSYVDIPAGGNWNGGKEKINAAFAFGGANLAAKTIYNLTQVPVNGAMIVNFAGVVNMVDAVGGVHVCVPYDVPNFFTEDFPQYNNGWAAGCHDMMGEEAEVFMRQRHDVPGGDLGRIKSQQLVMKALASKATSAGVLTNPGKLDSLLVTAAQSLTVDKNMNLKDLAFALKGIKPDNISFATAPVTGLETIDGVGSTVQLDMPGTQELFKAVLEDKTDEWLTAHPQPAVASI